MIFDNLKNLFASPERRETEYTKALDARNAKYGVLGEVSASYANSIFESVVLPSVSDFVRVKNGLLVKQVNDDIFHVINFRRGKFFYSFWWGVSLSYVPEKWDDACKFHRTLKSAHLDLFETSDGLVKDPYSAEIFQFSASFLNGEQCFCDELARAWKNLEPIIRNWLATSTTLEGVLKMAEIQIAQTRKGFPQHSPIPKLVYAFTLARMGRMSEGLIALEELMKSNSQFYSSDELPKALRQIADLNK